MAKFVFKMQNILDIKLRLETQAKTEFAEASGRLATEEERLKALIMRKREYELEAARMSSGRLDVNELKKQNQAIKTVRELMEQQALRVRIAEKNLDKARQKLNDAMQERKTYEKLKENAFEQFKLEINDEEKKEIDQLVSFKYNDNVKEE